MKTKKLNKKLIFNKQTVSHLGGAEMEDVHGGKDWSAISRCTCDAETCQNSFCSHKCC